MTKLELRMQNNELEARVIELEAIHADDEEKLADLKEELRILDDERSQVQDQCDLLQAQYRDLEQAIEEEAASRPAIPYAEWYRMIHPVPGGNPDLRALDTTAHVRILA